MGVEGLPERLAQLVTALPNLGRGGVRGGREAGSRSVLLGGSPPQSASVHECMALQGAFGWGGKPPGIHLESDHGHGLRLLLPLPLDLRFDFHEG